VELHHLADKVAKYRRGEVQIIKGRIKRAAEAHGVEFDED
jgi:hypothetical protein